VGGGKVHTPHPRSYELAMPKKMRRAALRSALSVKAAEASIVVVDQLSVSEPKTRLMAKSLTKLVGDGKVLIVIPEKAAYESVIRSTNNLPDAKVILANYLNIRDLLQYDKVVMPVAVLDVLSANFG
jgi:large subunit ribosomal protein L4